MSRCSCYIAARWHSAAAAGITRKHGIVAHHGSNFTLPHTVSPTANHCPSRCTTPAHSRRVATKCFGTGAAFPRRGRRLEQVCATRAPPHALHEASPPAAIMHRGLDHSRATRRWIQQVSSTQRGPKCDPAPATLGIDQGEGRTEGAGGNPLLAL